MKDLGILIAAGVGLYIISQRNKEKEPKKLNDNVGDTFEPENQNENEDPVRSITADELTSGQINESEAYQVALSAQQIEALNSMFDIQLQIANIALKYARNKNNFVEGANNDTQQYLIDLYEELIDCISDLIDEINNIGANRPLTSDIIYAMEDFTICTKNIQASMSNQVGNPESIFTPESLQNLEQEIMQVIPPGYEAF